MKKFFLLLFLFTFFSTSALSFDFDMTDPLITAKKAYEYGLSFEYGKLKVISIEDIFCSIDKAEKQSEQVVELFKRNGIDFYKESMYDFENISSALVLDDGVNVKVHLTGSYIFEVKDKIRKIYKINRFVFLKKIDGFYYFVGSGPADI